MSSFKLSSLVPVIAALLIGCGGEEGTDYSNVTDPMPDADGGTSGGTNSSLPPLGDGVGTLAGASEGGAVDGARSVARFYNPVNVVVGPGGNLYVADYDNSLIRVVSPDGTVRTLIRQQGFNRPFGLVFTPDGRLYAETDSNDLGARNYEAGTLWRIEPEGRAILLLRNLGRPRGMAALPDNRIVLSDPEHHVLRVYDPAMNRITDLAGARDRPGYVDAAGLAARFNRPYDVVFSGGRVLVADQENHRLRAVTLDGMVTTFAGAGTAGTDDGQRMSARFNRPQALALDILGNVFVTDFGSYRVRRVAPDGAVTTIAGAGRAGYADNADPMMAQFFGMEGMDVSPDGRNLYITDGNRGGMEAYHRVRRFHFVR